MKADSTVNNAASTHHAPEERAPALRNLVDRVVTKWRSRGGANARRLLEEHPELLADRSVVLDLVLEEYCLRRDRGEQLGPTTYRERFESFGVDLATSIERLIEAEQLVAEHEISRSALLWPNAGETVEGFQVIDEIGRGGLARVYLCREPRVGGRLVVIKLSAAETKEPHWLGRCDHPRIVPIHSMSPLTDGNGVLICMPYLGKATVKRLIDEAASSGEAFAGSTLRRLVHADEYRSFVNEADDEWLALDRSEFIESLFYQLADALAHAHEKRIVHGDIKPSNILLTARGAVLIDFNLSQHQDYSERLLGGTLPYLAPECHLALASKRRVGDGVGPEADLFALGITIAEATLGDAPDAARRQSIAAEAERGATYVAQRDFVLRAAKTGFINEDTAACMIACIAKDPGERPTAKNLRAGLANSVDAHLKRGTQRPISRRLVTTAALAGVGAISLRVLVGPSRQSPASRYEVALSHLTTGDDSGAARILREVLEDSPGHLASMYTLAWLLIGNGRIDEALSVLEQLEAQAPDRYIAASIGYCFAIEGRYTPGTPWYLRVPQSERDAAIHNNLAVCLWLGRGARPRGERMADARESLGAAGLTGHHAEAVQRNLILLETARVELVPDSGHDVTMIGAALKLAASSRQDEDQLACVRLLLATGLPKGKSKAVDLLDHMLKSGVGPELRLWRTDRWLSHLHMEADLDHRVALIRRRIGLPEPVLLTHQVIHPTLDRSKTIG